MRLALGTVQFGLPYGAFNQAGQVSPGEVGAILALAAESGIEMIDTAHAYGNAEEALGAALKPDTGFRIVTKTAVKSAAVAADFRESLRRLKRDRVYGLLVHHASELLGEGGQQLWAALESLRADGLVTKIGSSVYCGDEIDALLSRFPLELVQLPINVFDQRLIQGGQLQRLKSRGIEIHARSAFLQGLLLSPLSRLPPNLERARRPLETYFHALEQAGLSRKAAALQFLKLQPQIDELVLGVESRAQLEENFAAFHEPLPAFDFSPFALSDERILNPALWGKG